MIYREPVAVSENMRRVSELVVGYGEKANYLELFV